MSDGHVEQIGTPAEVYEDPATVFVADFLGVSNLTDAEVVSGDGRECAIRIGEFTLRSACGDVGARGRVKIVARPERVELLPFDAPDRDNSVPGLVERTIYIGANVRVIVRLATGQVMQAQITNTGTAADYRQGTALLLRVPPEALRVLAAQGGASVEPSEEALPAEAVAARGA